MRSIFDRQTLDYPRLSVNHSAPIVAAFAPAWLSLSSSRAAVRRRSNAFRGRARPTNAALAGGCLAAIDTLGQRISQNFWSRPFRNEDLCQGRHVDSCEAFA